jgi:cytochrome c oxidase subunit 2
MISEEDLNFGEPRLIVADTAFVLPTYVQIILNITSADVLHSFAVPAFGIKVDACPGRLNTTTFVILHEGLFFGQCSELCGVNHAFMPIMIKAVTQADYLTRFIR